MGGDGVEQGRVVDEAGHFDAVVIGTGFGGAVIAARLAEAGWKVCVLERGKAYPPNSFPRSPGAMRGAFWDPSEGGHGLYNVWSFRHTGALVASGLGGGSLIYANVLLRKDPDSYLAAHGWPLNANDLEPHYEEVEKAIGISTLPNNEAHHVRKTDALERAAQEIAVTFAQSGVAPGEPIPNAPPSFHGRVRHTCNLCGECNVGCNTGAKNTLDHNYLERARRAGADIRIRAEAKTFTPLGNMGRETRFAVEYADHRDAVEGEERSTPPPVVKIVARHVVLSAGAYGSTFLMLKNADKFPHRSASLGTRMSGNGDLLAFVLRTRELRKGTPRKRMLDPSHGPVITSAIRMPGVSEEQGLFYLEDAGFPAFLSWILESADVTRLVPRTVRFLTVAMRSWLHMVSAGDVSERFANLIGDTDLSSSSLPLLAMGLDSPDGRAILDDAGQLDVDWALDASRAYFERIRETTKNVAKRLGGDALDNPLWWLNRVITVHPLGGCPMGKTIETGVVDSYGEVFGQRNFWIADGSVMPGPVGPNPSLTIAAVANRTAAALIARG
jgi:cholesterol oxidase